MIFSETMLPLRSSFMKLPVVNLLFIIFLILCHLSYLFSNS